MSQAIHVLHMITFILKSRLTRIIFENEKNVKSSRVSSWSSLTKVFFVDAHFLCTASSVRKMYRPRSCPQPRQIDRETGSYKAVRVTSSTSTVPGSKIIFFFVQCSSNSHLSNSIYLEYIYWIVLQRKKNKNKTKLSTLGIGSFLTSSL